MKELMPVWSALASEYFVAGFTLDFSLDTTYRINLYSSTFAYGVHIKPNKWRIDNSKYSSKPLVQVNQLAIYATPYGIIDDEIFPNASSIIIVGVSPDAPFFYVFADSNKPSIGSVNGRYK